MLATFTFLDSQCSLPNLGSPLGSAWVPLFYCLGETQSKQYAGAIVGLT